MVGGNAPRQMIEPRGEFALVPVGVPVFEDPLENDLDQVFGGVAIADQASEKTEQGAMVALEEVAQTTEFARADGEHKIVIAGFGHGMRRR